MNIVLIWAWWTGISSLWFLFTQLWYNNIIWIDSTESQITKALEKTGIQIILGHGIYQVTQDDFVIFSDAAPQAPEVLQAKERVSQGIKWARPPISYFQFLWEISKLFETISIAGTHGKSTTTAMLIYTMSQSDPQFWLWILGALVPQLNNTNYRINPTIKDDIANIFTFILTWNYKIRDESLRKKYRFVIEADEFNRHFLYLDTDYAIILNAELDHSDIYPNEKVYMDTFIEFTHKVRKQTFVLPWEKWIAFIMKHW
jgi:UDP-N-acetylmuramate--alanine ligase